MHALIKPQNCPHDISEFFLDNKIYKLSSTRMRDIFANLVCGIQLASSLPSTRAVA